MYRSAPAHRDLRPGLLESAYERCLAHELELHGLSVECQRPVPLRYKGVSLDCGYRLDLVVDHALLVEVKAVDRLLPIHHAQVLTYLRLTELRVGLLPASYENGSLTLQDPKVLRAEGRA